MTLAFSTQINGKPNYFTNKIVKGLWKSHGNEFSEFIKLRTAEDDQKFDRIKPFENLSVYESEKLYPKIHTIRKDVHNRWKPGTDIHMVINNRTENRFQFAPTIKCMNVQRIEIEWRDYGTLVGRQAFVYINYTIAFGFFWEKTGEYYRSGTSALGLKNLANNDGFDSVQDFFAYFNTDFTGKIIHWTDLKY